MGIFSTLPSITENYIFCVVKAKHDITFQIMTSDKKPFIKFCVLKATKIYFYGINTSNLAKDKDFDINLILKNQTFTIYKGLKPANIKKDFFIFENNFT